MLPNPDRMRTIRRFFIREFWILGLLITSLLISCYLISAKKYFWNDELFSWYFIADHSFSHMLAAFGDRLNQTPILYFASGWVWARIFGASELSLRLFTSLGFCLAAVVSWLTLRRSYRFWPATIGVLTVFCTSKLILSQNAEARMYGLFVAVCSLGLFLYDQLSRQLIVSRSVLFCNLVVQAAIVHTHLFGLFYGPAILLALILNDRLQWGWAALQKRIRIYASFFIGWLSLVFYIPAYLIQTEAGKPHSWIPQPTIRDLTDFFAFHNPFLRLTIPLAILLIAGLQVFIVGTLAASTDQAWINPNSQSTPKFSLLILACTFLFVPVFTWCVSLSIRPIMFDRYLMPTLFSWVILVAEMADRLIFNIGSISSNNFHHSFRWFPRLSYILFPLILVTYLVFQPIIYGAYFPAGQAPDLEDNTYGHYNLPIVIQSSDWFLERRFYSLQKERYFFILDRELAEQEASGLFGLQEYKHMEAWNRRYPAHFAGHVLTSQDFLQQYPSFLVITRSDYRSKCSYKVTGANVAIDWNTIHCPQWVAQRLLNNPNYQVKSLGPIGGGYQTVLLVNSTQSLSRI
uniref:Glycosyltransferase RgtA/B/C/D-like domain-containing protein n=1 Tax=Cyanothece sp. (strain PCC 7425 / ATCC 29141) TaxID=395961 RepID=B8HMN2_CYAP4